MPEGKRIIWTQKIDKEVCVDLIPIQLLDTLLHGIKRVLKDFGIIIADILNDTRKLAEEILETLGKVKEGRIAIKLPKTVLPKIKIELPEIKINLPDIILFGDEDSLEISKEALLYRKEKVWYYENFHHNDMAYSNAYAIAKNKSKYAEIIGGHSPVWGDNSGYIEVKYPIDDRLYGNQKEVANFFNDTIKQFEANKRICSRIDIKIEVYVIQEGSYYVSFEIPQQKKEFQLTEASFEVFTIGVFSIQVRINDVRFKDDKLESFRINIDACILKINEIPNIDLLPDFLRERLDGYCQNITNFRVKP